MRLLGVALAVLTTALTLLFLRGGARDGSPAPRSTAATRSSALRDVERPTPKLARDPFRYVDGRRTPPDPVVRAAPVDTLPVPAASVARPVRLVGFVRGDELRAALVIDGEVVLAAAGDKPSGYEILAVDEDAGVSIRDRAGDTFTLVPP